MGNLSARGSKLPRGSRPLQWPCFINYDDLSTVSPYRSKRGLSTRLPSDLVYETRFSNGGPWYRFLGKWRDFTHWILSCVRALRTSTLGRAFETSKYLPETA